MSLQFRNADPRDISSISNWIEGTGCIARAESGFLEKEDDMANLSGSLDDAVSFIEIFVEKWAFKVARLVKQVSAHFTSF